MFQEEKKFKYSIGGKKEKKINHILLLPQI